MARTVDAAFTQFLRESVNLNWNDYKEAIRSTKPIFSKISYLAQQRSLPPINHEKHLVFGSLARKTEIERDFDVDVLVCFSSEGLAYSCGGTWCDCKLETARRDGFLFEKCFDRDNKRISSDLFKDAFVESLLSIQSFSRASEHDGGEAVSMSLDRYDWDFDIVPGFYFTEPGRSFYLIPNGHGGWKKTNPRIENNRMRKIDARFGHVASETVRLIKYWNRVRRMPNAQSYLLETMVLQYFNDAEHCSHLSGGGTFDCCKYHLPRVMKYIADNIEKPVWDLKGIQGDVNCLSKEQRDFIRERADHDSANGFSAYEAEVEKGNQKSAINLWREVFGREFPSYD